MATKFDLLLIGGIAAVVVGAFVFKVPPFNEGGLFEQASKFLDARLQGRDTPTTDAELLRQMQEQGIAQPIVPGTFPPETANEAPWFNTNTGQPLVKTDPSVQSTFLQEVWKQVYFPPSQYPQMYNFPQDTRLRQLSTPYNPSGSVYQIGYSPIVQGGDTPRGVGVDPYVFDQLCQLYQICPPGGSTHPTDDFFYDGFEFGTGGLTQTYQRTQLDECHNCPGGTRWDTCLCTCVDINAVTPQCFAAECATCPQTTPSQQCIQIGGEVICYSNSTLNAYDCVNSYEGKCYNECVNPTSSACKDCVKKCGSNGF